MTATMIIVIAQETAFQDIAVAGVDTILAHISAPMIGDHLGHPVMPVDDADVVKPLAAQLITDFLIAQRVMLELWRRLIKTATIVEMTPMLALVSAIAVIPMPVVFSVVIRVEAIADLNAKANVRRIRRCLECQGRGDNTSRRTSRNENFSEHKRSPFSIRGMLAAYFDACTL